MKIFISISFIVSLATCSKSVSQTTEYYPEKRKGITQEHFDHGTKILEQTYQRINNKSGQKDFSDYWNFAVAYTYLGESTEEIKKMIIKSYQSDPELFSAASKIKPDMIEEWKKIFSENEYQKMFKNIKVEAVEEKKEIPITTVKNELEMDNGKHDKELVKLMHQIRIDDQKYRVGKNQDAQLQAALDAKNLKIIDSLYDVHQCYIGKSLVGKKYESVMWAVIQHSDLEVMEKYLPVVHQAVIKDDLAEGPLKLLIDRIYALKYGYQIFDSQYAEPAIPTAPAHIVEKVLKEYGLTKNRRNKSGINNSSETDKKKPAKTKDKIIRWDENNKIEN